MGTYAAVIGALLLIGGVFTILVLVVEKFIKNRIVGALTREYSPLHDKSESLETEIYSHVDKFETMVPAKEVNDLENQTSQIETSIKEDTATLESLESQVTETQESVDRKEARHGDLKAGKEKADLAADELRADGERLKSESSQLETKIADSQAELEGLLGGVELTESQEMALKEIRATVEKKREQLAEVADVYAVGNDRFLNLKHQYEQLELEYKNLIEEQLSGPSE